MTDLAAKIKRLSAAATPGEWHLQTGAIGINPWISAENWTRPNGSYVRGGCILNMVAHDEREQDAALIATMCSESARKQIAAALRAQQHAEALADALSDASEELEYFVDFARRQCEFEGDDEAGMAAVRNARAALAAYRSVK